MQAACYPCGGTCYHKHPDNLVIAETGTLTNWRILTAIAYANAGWMPEHGGHLRIYDGNSHVDLEPIAGRIVIFNSLLVHEVLPCWRNRFALTLWIWREDEDASKQELS